MSPIQHVVEQNSEAWLKLRTGLPTASGFDKIVTPGGKLSEQSTAYMYTLLAEQYVGHVVEFESKYMERGHELEGEAVAAYEFQTNSDTAPGGFWTNAAGTYGASPDRLLVVNGETRADDGTAFGLLEIKCPAAHTHIAYMLKKPVDKKYMPQLQGQMLVTGAQFVDIVSYYPELPIAIVRVPRDEQFIALLRMSLDAFLIRMTAEKAILTAGTEQPVPA